MNSEAATYFPHPAMIGFEAFTSRYADRQRMEVASSERLGEKSKLSFSQLFGAQPQEPMIARDAFKWHPWPPLGPGLRLHHIGLRLSCSGAPNNCDLVPSQIPSPPPRPRRTSRDHEDRRKSERISCAGTRSQLFGAQSQGPMIA